MRASRGRRPGGRPPATPAPVEGGRRATDRRRPHRLPGAGARRGRRTRRRDRSTASRGRTARRRRRGRRGSHDSRSWRSVRASPGTSTTSPAARRWPRPVASRRPPRIRAPRSAPARPIVTAARATRVGPASVISSAACSGSLPTSRFAMARLSRSAAPDSGTPRCVQSGLPASWMVVRRPPSRTSRRLGRSAVAEPVIGRGWARTGPPPPAGTAQAAGAPGRRGRCRSAR